LSSVEDAFRPGGPEATPGLVAKQLRVQAGWCQRLGSPLYASLLARAAEDVASEGPVWALVRRPEAGPPGSLLPVRLMGGVHRLVLEGGLPDLAAAYPSAGGRADPDAAWQAFRAAVADRADELAPLVARPVQTNEVMRSAALLLGFLAVARKTGLPLRLLEVGASAGLNLRWDRYRYQTWNGGWGDPGSPVQLTEMYEPPEPRLDPPDVDVVERAGCDRAPVDPTSEEGRLTLQSYVWPDQEERFRLLRGALQIAPAVPVRVDEARLADWIEERLGEPSRGAATVVFHSIVMSYLEAEERERFNRAVADAGGRASEEAPLAWLRMEPGGEQAEVLLATWPGGEDRLIATSGFHGRPVRVAE
jgi:hypothetical protein